jgi:galactosyl transferase GMA12/MNN10 family
MWPAYDNDLPTTSPGEEPWEKVDEKDWRLEVTTLPAEATHTPLVPAVVVDPEQPDTTPEAKVEGPEPTAAPATYPATAWGATPLPALNTTFHVPSDIFYDPRGPRPEQVVVVTATDGKGHNGGIENIIEQTSENRKAYCAHHGYQYHFVNISKFDLEGAHPVWKKLPAIVDAFNTYPDAQWIFFLDLDAIIMSPKQDLNSLVLSHQGMRKALARNTQFHAGGWDPLPYWTPEEPDYENIDLLIAQDHNGINAGSFFLRRSKFTQWLLDMWADPFFMKMDWPGQEQETLVSVSLHCAHFSGDKLLALNKLFVLTILPV